MFLILVTEEYDHVRRGKLLTAQQTHTLEQGQADRGKASTTTKTRLVDQNSIAVGGANT
jgi:hypothetical protein